MPSCSLEILTTVKSIWLWLPKKQRRRCLIGSWWRCRKRTARSIDATPYASTWNSACSIWPSCRRCLTPNFRANALRLMNGLRTFFSPVVTVFKCSVCCWISCVHPCLVDVIVFCSSAVWLILWMYVATNATCSPNANPPLGNLTP